MSRLLIAAAMLILILPPSAAGQEGNMSIEEFLQKLSTVPDVINRKDPFISAEPPFDSLSKFDADENIVMKNPVLQRYPVSQYSVVATLLGDQYPRALVKLPPAEKSKVLIVKVKDKLGSRGGIITRIMKDGIVVVENKRSPLGRMEKSEVTINVGGDEDSGSIILPEKKSGSGDKSEKDEGGDQNGDGK